MKKLLLILLITSTFQLYSQTTGSDVKPKTSTLGSVTSDAFIINLYTDIWQNVPDSIKNRTINQGMSVAGMYNIKMGKGNLSFAFGLGVSSHNFYSNGLLGLDTNLSCVLYPIPSEVNGKAIHYQVNKLSVTYLQIPIEFRFKTASKFRFALGFNFGFRFDVHTKYRGDNYNNADGGIFVKTKKIANLEKMNYTISARIGYKWAILNASYSLNSMFKKDTGPQLYPISIGLTAIPF
jgi:hypothetical protein